MNAFQESYCGLERWLLPLSPSHPVARIPQSSITPVQTCPSIPVVLLGRGAPQLETRRCDREFWRIRNGSGAVPSHPMLSAINKVNINEICDAHGPSPRI